MKDGEDQKTKTYEALCTFEDYQIEVQNLRSKIMELGIVTISQKTPIRVLHRRPNLERKRTVEFLGVEEVAKDRQCFKLRIRTQAGTYVKEFVHGDFGRTIPNLRTLLHHDIDIIALDVEVTIIIIVPPGPGRIGGHYLHTVIKKHTTTH